MTDSNVHQRTRRLPDNPNAEQLKNQAKDILKAHKRGDESCCDILEHLKRLAGKSISDILASAITLQEAQQALAQSYDWSNWSAMMQTVATMNSASVDGNADPVMDFVDSMLVGALKSGAAQLYFEPYEFNYRVRYKTDGLLHTVATPPVELGLKIAEKLKEKASMDLAVCKSPASGQIPFKISRTKTIQFKLSIVPTVFGENIKLLILDASAVLVGFDKLGLFPDQVAAISKGFHQRNGLMLVTGPVESGKTVTLLTGVNELNTPECHIVSIEEPVEVLLEGVNQISVEANGSTTTRNAVATALQQAPQVLVVSEIKSAEVAELVINAAHGGQRVLATLKADSAVDAVLRLQDMGSPAAMVLQATTLVCSQRLVRRLCEKCKVPVSLSEADLLQAGFSQQQIEAGLALFEAAGCEACHGGFLGRVGCFELLDLNPEITAAFKASVDQKAITAACQQAGFKNMRRSALLRVKEGVTSLAEVNRMLGDERPV